MRFCISSLLSEKNLTSSHYRFVRWIPKMSEDRQAAHQTYRFAKKSIIPDNTKRGNLTGFSPICLVRFANQRTKPIQHAGQDRTDKDVAIPTVLNNRNLQVSCCMLRIEIFADLSKKN